MSLNQYIDSKPTILTSRTHFELARRTDMLYSRREGDNHHGRQPHPDWHPHLRRQPDQSRESEPCPFNQR